MYSDFATNIPIILGGLYIITVTTVKYRKYSGLIAFLNGLIILGIALVFLSRREYGFMGYMLPTAFIWSGISYKLIFDELVKRVKIKPCQ